jgi:putative PIN family toxin of toxin-antitoxin system
MNHKKVIFDTNIWISYLISDKFIYLDELIESGIIKTVFSDELLEEFIDVAKRKKFKKFFSEDDIRNVIEIISDYGIFFEVVSNIKICRDRKDDFLLNLAIDSKADYLVTGDSDILIIGQIGTTKILSVKEFILEIKK